ncbi:MAG: halocarboxylic acid dehydrogenase DehI family protein [Alphaproteobacteria bacterium]|nr:halocarboxylic acid dehydrogenase DehI family protein [Alphaproteobacteria bacterium]
MTGPQTASGDPVPSITEAEADGEIARTYDDIRRTLGVPVVNLIWRRLAVIPGGLDWAWSGLKPLYASGAIQAAGRALRHGLSVPDVPVLPRAALRAAGVDAVAEQTIRTILDTYDRSNPLNLVALQALLAVSRGDIDEGAAPDFSDASDSAVEGALPTLLALKDMAGPAADLVTAVNRFGARGADHILVSMPRQLAHWPGFLALYWSLVAPYDADGRLAACIDSVLSDGRASGRRLAAGMRHVETPAPALRQAVDPVLEDFLRHAIARMIPVVALLQQAMPPRED